MKNSQAIVNDPTLVKTFRGHTDHITSVSFHPMMQSIASSSADSTICVWSLRANTRPYKFVGHKAPVTDLEFSPNGAFIASASKDCTVKIWNNNIEGKFSTIKAHTAAVRSV
jgi:centriolar protein POC1